MRCLASKRESLRRRGETVTGRSALAFAVLFLW